MNQWQFFGFSMALLPVKSRCETLLLGLGTRLGSLGNILGSRGAILDDLGAIL